MLAAFLGKNKDKQSALFKASANTARHCGLKENNLSAHHALG